METTLTNFLQELYDKDPTTQIKMIGEHLDELIPFYHNHGIEDIKDHKDINYDDLDELFENIDVKQVCQTALINLMERTDYSDIRPYLAYRDTFYYKLYDILPYDLYLKL